MCCFSPVAMPIGLLARLLGLGPRAARVRVARTRIHARMHDDGTQSPVLHGVGWGDLPPSWNDDVVSLRQAREFMRMGDVQDLLAAEEPVAMRSLHGELPNQDTWIPLAPPAAGEGAAPRGRRVLLG